MKLLKRFMLGGISLFFLFTFSSISMANTANSQAGISFTEKEEVGAGGEILQKNKELPNTQTDRTSLTLPQTGESKDWKLLIVGWVLLVAVAVIKRGGIKMKLKMMAAVGLIGSGMLVGTSVVNAEETAVQEETPVQEEIKGSANGKGGTSHGYINLTQGDDTITEPEEPTVPPGGTHNKGVLTLDNIAPLLFSTHKLDGQQQVYTSVVENSNVQVTDKRGDEAGWHVQVSQTPFVDKLDSTKVLKGTTLILPAGVVKSAGNISVAPTVNAVEVNADLATLMSAAKGSGAGTWRTVFDKDEVKLTVAAGNKKGEYMSTVTWALMDAPE